jgi:hypothetical protein
MQYTKGVVMEQKFVVITEIYFDGEKISRSRQAKEYLDTNERDQLIRTMYNILLNQKIRYMDIYANISISLKEKYGIEISERSIMRSIKKM